MQTFPVKIYNLPTPAGIDAEIGKMQQRLAAITWLDTIFGRANIQRRQLTDAEVANRLTQTEGVATKDLKFVFYPQGRKLDQDIDLSFSDAYPSTVFFYLKDPINVSPDTDKWDSIGEDQVQVAQPVSMIFSCDMKKLDPTRTDNFSEQLKITLLSILNKIPRIAVSAIVESGSAVLKDFSVTQQLLTFTRYPYCAFRFDMICTYPAFPENGNAAFNPTIYTDGSRETTTPNSSPGSSNLN